MIEGLKPYPERRGVGGWLGSLPRHWIDLPISRFARVGNGSTPSRSEAGYWAGGTEPWLNSGAVHQRKITHPSEFVTERALRECHLPLVPRGSVLVAITGQGKTRGCSALLLRESTINQHLAFVTPRRDRALPEYLLDHLAAAYDELRGISDEAGSTRGALTCADLKAFRVALPPLDEQRAIVRFLDYADRRIRRYIAAKRKLIALLEEQKRAIIDRAVTRGLDPNVRLKDSGVPWLGMVPEHWSVARVRTMVLRIDQGKSPQAENSLADGRAWGVLKAGCVNRGLFREVQHKRLPTNFLIGEDLVVREGDVLVSRASGSADLVGSVGRVRDLTRNLILSDKTFRLVFKDDRLSDYTVAAMNSRAFRRQVELSVSGAEGLARNLPLSSLRDFLLPLPPCGEAQQIAEVLRGRTELLGSVVGNLEREVVLLHEFRTRLISDVVTGKLDVREAAARLPDEPLAELSADAPLDDAAGAEDTPDEMEDAS